MGYSHDSVETNTSLITPSGVTVDLSTSCNTIVVFLKAPWRLSFNIVSLPMTLIVSRRSISALGTTMLLMCTSTIGILGSKYFGEITLPSIISDNFSTKLIMGASLFILPSLLKYSSLISLL